MSTTWEHLSFVQLMFYVLSPTILTNLMWLGRSKCSSPLFYWITGSKIKLRHERGLQGQRGVRLGRGNVTVFLFFVGVEADNLPPSKQAQTYAETQIHTCISLYWLVLYCTDFLSLYLSPSIYLCLIQYSPSPIRPCFILRSATPIPAPLTLSHMLWCLVRPFTLHLTYINQSVTRISFREKPERSSSEPPYW